MNRNLPVLSCLWILLLAPVLMLGAVHPLTLALTAILAAITGLMLCLTRSCDWLKLDWITTLLLIAVGATALQMLPLPSPLVHILSPSAFDLRTTAAAALSRPTPAWMPITLDVTATFQEFTRLLIYILAYWSALFLVRRQGSAALLKIVMLAGALCAGVFLAHRILLLDLAYGFYEPEHLHPSRTNLSAPLLNSNHMGGFFALTATVAIGLAVETKDRTGRWLLIGISALIGGSLLLTLSRGAIVAFLAGQIVFIAILLFRRWTSTGTSESRLRRLSFLPLGLAFSLTLGMFVAQDAIIGEFVNGDIKKIDILKESLPLIGQFPLTGVGRGAFFAGFPLVSDWAAAANFTHAENIVVQLICDFGLPIGLILIAGFVTLTAAALARLPRKAHRAGAVAAILTVGIHNLVDFNLEIPGVAVVVFAILAVIVSEEYGKWPIFQWIERFQRPLPRYAVAIISFLGVISAFICALYLPDRTVNAEEGRAEMAFREHDNRFFESNNLAAVLERHPASWYTALLTGVQRFGVGDPSAMRWLGRATMINPHSAAAHFHIARALLSRGALSQAMLECSLASRFDPAYATHCARILTRFRPVFSDLSAIATEPGERAILYGSLAAAFVLNGHPLEAEKADLAALRTSNPTEASFVRQIRRLALRKQIDEARKLSARMIRNGFDGPGAALLASEIAGLNGLPDEELRKLKEGLLHFPDDPVLLRQLISVETRNKNWDAAIKTCRKLYSIASNEYQAALAVELEGDVENSAGRMHSALSRYRQASAMLPENVSVLNKVLQTARAMNNDQLILEVLLRMVELHPNDPHWARALQDQQIKMQPRDMI